MNTKWKNKEPTISYWVFIGIVIFTCFYPTSINGKIQDEANTFYICAYYGIAVLLSLLYMFTNEIALRRLKLLVYLMIYLAIATVISCCSIGGEFAFARLIYIFIAVVVLSTNDLPMINRHAILTSMEILTFVIIVWNLCIILHANQVIDFSIAYYSQFNSSTTAYYIQNRRPMFTFGAYSYASLFYALLFGFWYAATNNEVRKYTRGRYYAYLIALIVFQFLLRGSIAFLLGSFMAFMFVKHFANRRSGLVLLPIFLLAAFCFVCQQNYDWTRLLVGNETNGFFSRYNTNMFEDNFKAISETILGIGYSITQDYNIRYTDSGYIVLFTMGNAILPIAFYCSLYQKLKNNVPKALSRLVFIMLMLFEISLPSLIYAKTVLFLGAITFGIKSVSANKVPRCKNENKVEVKVGL